MPTLTIPQLKPAVDLLIDRMYDISVNGEGSIGFFDLMEIFPGLSSIEKHEMTNRGALTFFNGIFENSGSSVDYKVQIGRTMLRIKVPDYLKGTYTASPDGFVLTFDEVNTIIGCAHIVVSWICRNLHSIRVDRDSIFIDLGWDIANVFIQFE